MLERFPETVRVIRVFVSSPGDVAEERRVLDEVVASINRIDGQRDGFRLELFRWEDDVVPQIGPKPQQGVDDQSPPVDLYLGILSSRFGTPTGRYGSGTEKEFRYAVKTWAKSGAPWIMFYFHDTPRLSFKSEDALQYVRVCEFRQELESKGVVSSYSGVRGSRNSFFELVSGHLRKTAVLLTSNESAHHTTSRSSADLGSKEPPIPREYLRWLQNRCDQVDLLGLRVTQGQAVRLKDIYTPLLTVLHERDIRPHDTRHATDESDPHGQLILSLLESESLYVTGPPGSGKSTFCRWVAWLTCEGSMPEASVTAPHMYQEAFPQSFRGRLPLLIRLRDFWSFLPLASGDREMSSAELARALGLWMEGTQPGGLSWGAVKGHMENGTLLMILDGVDELPLTHGESNRPCLPRAMFLSGLTAALEDWIPSGNRVLLTSRPYGLRESDAFRLSLRHTPLGDLDHAMRELLVKRWFRCLIEDQDSAERIASQMLQHVSQRGDLQPLSVNPMLLTSMCILYHQGGRFPQHRHDLYDRIVDNVLFNRFPDDREVIDPVRNRLVVVAYGMHTGEGLGEERMTPQAEVTYAEIDRMIQNYQEQTPWSEAGYSGAVQAREQLLSRTGLLLPQGEQRAGFYHLTLQDFLAAQRLLDL